MAKGKGKKKKGEGSQEGSQQQGSSQQPGPSQQQPPAQQQAGGQGDSGSQGQPKKFGKKGQQQQGQPQQTQQQQPKGGPQQGGQQPQQKGGPQQGGQPQQQRGEPPQGRGQQLQPAPSGAPQGQPGGPPPQQHAWGRGQQPQGRGRGQIQGPGQTLPPGAPQGAPQGQPSGPPLQQQTWGRGQQPQGRGLGQSQGRGQTLPPGAPQGPPQQKQLPPGFTQPQQQRKGPPQQQQLPPGFPQPQQQSKGPPPHQQQVPVGYPQPQQTPTQSQQQGRDPPPQQQQRQAPPGFSQPQQTPTQWQQQRGGPPFQQQQRQQPAPGPSQPQREGGDFKRGPQQSPRKGPGSSDDFPVKEMKKLDVRPTREDAGDDKIVSKIRFKPGTEGRVIKVESNHLSLNLGNLKQAYHYDVAIGPDTPKKFLRPVMERFRLKHFPNRYPAFDGKKNLYASAPLSNNLTDILADEITVDDGGREKNFKVQVKFANTVDLTPLKDLFNHPVTPREALQCVDIVLRSAPSMRLISVGRSFFTKPSQIIDLGQGMEMYSGFFQSTVRGWRPLLNVDVAHKAFPKTINVVDALAEVLTQNPRSPVTRESLRELRDWEVDTFNRFMRTLRVVYQIPNQPGSKREFRVNQLWQPASNARFTCDGRTMTVAEYFRNVKHYNLRYPDLPTLHVGSMQREDKILLPMELCTIFEGQALNRKMTETQTSNMIRQAATDTKRRKEKIMTGIQTADYNSSPCVREFGFSVGNQFQQLDARVLRPPELQYKDRKARVSRGVWRNEQFLNAVKIERWTIKTACQRPPRPDDLMNMAEELQKAARNCGIVFANPPEQPYRNIDMRSGQKGVRQHFEGLKDKYDVIFVVVQDSGPSYSYVKTAAEINVGCLTQCVKQGTLFKRMNTMTAANILLKVNAKLAGTNHALATKPKIMARPVMIMGADVTHPGPESRDIPSVAAVTASHDPRAFQYNICWRLQPPTVEIIEDLENITVEQLTFFFEKNRCKPESIIFFRDGVSEGQFEQVVREEVCAIQRACKRMQKDGYEPKITFAVVQKRHHTRLFPKDARDSEDRNCNVPAGTCVDTDITHPFMQDFYLVSHASIQGVAKPTKYCTLWDDNKLTNDEIEQLAFYLCHMFTRCNRSVSYPAPTYYAHLAAARGKVYIENDRLNMDRLNEEFRRYTIKDEIRKGLPMFFV